MNRAELKSLAKEQIKGKIFTVFLMSLLVTFIAISCNAILVIGNIAYALIGPGLTIGFIMAYLSIAKGEEISVESLFKGLNIFAKAFWLNILMGFFTFLWTLLLWIPGVIKSLSYSAAPWILAESPELTASEALNKSKRVMNGYKWDLFILELSFIPWYILVIFTFGLASIYVTPYREVTLANFYKKIGAFEEEVTILETENIVV